ncbi:Oidioi.mRNA.OKI2018_I69.PAR.g10955.t1.cds [Oikopleura dioica]|uniref:Oidioi.mRNA.OKI2018_I69.PAR.g10955.t1.cds n=1 Tax=Oikopleura dioica TaxID=34765 RepID=A0ABN7RU30_OIKDI|nr:Oidioi.mRNA.OKI2018_I69.PAR.g10955.t1.cds [Oikopleura dioica]
MSTDFIRENLKKRKQRYDVWLELIEELNAAQNRADKFEEEKTQLEKVLAEESRSSPRESAVSGESDSVRSARISHLEQKCFNLQEELTELLRSKASTAEELSRKKDLVSELDDKLRLLQIENDEKNMKLQNYQNGAENSEEAIRELKRNHQVLLDEHAALQLAYSQLEKQIRAREQIAEYANAEAIAAAKLKDLQKKIDAENLIRDATKGVLPDAKITYTARSSPPIKKINQFEANNGEVFEVKFSPDGAHLATAGEDKCVNIYNVRNPASRIESPVLTLKGANAAITSLSFSKNRRHLLGSSNDQAARVWDLSSGKIVQSLTGHQGPVTTARYLTQSTAVTGSQDRTVRLWDLTKTSCTKTLWPGSKCIDVCNGSMDGSLIMSAHYNKQIHVTDIRASAKDEKQVISLSGRPTGIAVPADFGQSLLALTRNNDLAVIDLRQMQVRITLSDLQNDFRVTADYSRCSLSPCGGLALATGQDGRISCWDVNTGRLLDGANAESAGNLISCDWSSRLVATGSKSKTVVLWSD